MPYISTKNIVPSSTEMTMSSYCKSKKLNKASVTRKKIIKREKREAVAMATHLQAHLQAHLRPYIDHFKSAYYKTYTLRVPKITISLPHGRKQSCVQWCSGLFFHLDIGAVLAATRSSRANTTGSLSRCCALRGAFLEKGTWCTKTQGTTGTDYLLKLMLALRLDYSAPIK